MFEFGRLRMQSLCYDPRLSGEVGHRYWDTDGTVDESGVIEARVAPAVSVGPHLPEHETMPVLTPALSVASSK